MTEHQPAIRIVIADDHPLIRDGLRKLLELQPGFTIVGEAADGHEAVQRVKALKADVLLLDLAMPRMNGLEVLKELADTDAPVKTILLTAAIEREETVQALRLGARAVVLKEAATHMLYRCVRSVMAGELWVGHERIDDLMQTIRRMDRAGTGEGSPASRLTQRELQVIAAILEGATNKDIGKTFSLSEQTVKNHLSNIFDKLGVSNRLELALYAVHHRLLKGVDVAGLTAATQSPRKAPPRPKKTR
jgi:two-component system, NarL family, nitrate/nitrite response regulator NarL